MYRYQRYTDAISEETRMTKANKAKSAPRDSGKVTARAKGASKDANLLVRLDSTTKTLVQQAAGLRGLSVSDYVRSRIIPLARQDVDEANTGVLRLPKDAQIAFWQALQHPPVPTKEQLALGKLVRSVM
jgi:uncharacterized protein (DUF1778 family)